MNFNEKYLQHITRRGFFEHAFGQAVGFGIGTAALASLITEEGYAGAALKQEVALAQLHHAPKAKRVIYLEMCGGAPHVDMYDYKPLLQQQDGKDAPDHLYKGERFAFIRGVPKLAASPFAFQQYGQSGAWLGETLPKLTKVVDDITFLKGMQTTQFNHNTGQIYMNTGYQIPGRPAFGSWLSYGIGSENKDLPAYVVLLSGGTNPDGGSACWGSGFLPSVHQGVAFQKRGDPINFVSNPAGVQSETRRLSINLMNSLNETNYELSGDPEIETRIAAYEMAYKMQTSVPDLMDISRESPKTREAYGAVPGEPSFANNALLARRLLERGVRFVQLCHRYWDMHGDKYNEDIVNKTRAACRQTEGPIAALITDLKERGLFDDTLVIWATEFGRTPMAQPARYFGRDHHPKGYTIWMAGGGIKPGLTYGATDEWGYWAVENKTTPLDIFATALHLLGIDHEKFTYRFAGRDFRLTDVAGRVIKDILA